MKLINKTLITFNQPTKGGTIYLESEFTRIREWSRQANGSYSSGTLLEKLNSIAWFHQKVRKKDEYLEPLQIDLIPLYGELGHPEGFDTSTKNISHTIKNIKIEDNKLIGDITILDTNTGKQLKNIIEELGQDSVIFRPRSAGKINDNKEISNLIVFTFDAVQNDIFCTEDKQSINEVI